MIACEICNKNYKLITNTHLQKAHGITPQEYLERFPESQLYDEVMHEKIRSSRYSVERPECKREGCTNTVTQSWNKSCSTSCRSLMEMSTRDQSGDKNPNWTDGWYSIGKRNKKKARERDKYTCRNCDTVVKGRAAHVHHMVPERCFDDPEEAHKISNLVTLCNNCHLMIEWQVIRELHLRVYKLDEFLKDDPTHISFEAYKANLLTKE